MKKKWRLLDLRVEQGEPGIKAERLDMSNNKAVVFYSGDAAYLLSYETFVAKWTKGDKEPTLLIPPDDDLMSNTTIRHIRAFAELMEIRGYNGEA